jgi:hypothetical protein
VTGSAGSIAQGAFTSGVGKAYCLLMKVRYVYWQEDDHWLGYLEEFRDYWTQGESLEDLKEHLRDIHDDLSDDRIPEVRRTAELEVN